MNAINTIAISALLAGAGAVFCSNFAMAQGAEGAVSASPAASTPLAGARLVGQGTMRFLGFEVYRARLWAQPGFDADNYAAHPLALELTYHRAFTGAAIAQRSVEEMQRQASVPPTQAQRWQQRLTEVIPDVQPGDRLTGLYQPGQGMRLWRGNQELAAIDDAELARLFFGIWLSPQTSEPALRSALLARSQAATAP